MRLRVPLAAAAVLTVMVASAVPAGAAPAVAVSSVVVNGSTATVTGTASFTPITTPQNVGGTKTNFAQAAVADAAGINITGGQILPLANGSGLRFIWQLTSLPAQIPPEGVRYTWGFNIGTRTYQLQAKRTNLVSVSTSEDPVGHVQHASGAGDFFQLRGACVAAYLGAPVNGCYHLAFLNGGFDVANKTAWIELPFETKDAIGRVVAPDFKPGTTIVHNDGVNTAGMSIAASLQAVVSNTSSSSFINSWDPYFAGPQVSLAAGAASANPSTLTYSSPATLSGSTFTGTVSGLTPAKNTVFARACNGNECAYATQ